MIRICLQLLLALSCASGFLISSPRPIPKQSVGMAIPVQPTRHNAVTMGLGDVLLDLSYGVLFFGALAFAFRIVFDSIFFENEGFRPPMIVFNNPLAPEEDP